MGQFGDIAMSGWGHIIRWLLGRFRPIGGSLRMCRFRYIYRAIAESIAARPPGPVLDDGTHFFQDGDSLVDGLAGGL
jgi:hypothetical protein